MVELFSPVGDMASFRAAIKGGADAVYLGLKEFSMRHSAKNFSLKQVERMVIEAHENKINVYITLNTIIFDKEIKKVEKIIKKLKQIKVDAVICSDSAIINLAKKYKLSFIVSTQCSIANKESAKFYKKLGAKQVVLARELNLKQIKEISKVIDTEVFIHGAMCMAHSGRCFLSHQTIQKSANRGRCVQNCRRNYNVL
jgi:putative protease